MESSDLVVISNRGPLSFKREEDGTLTAQRGAGGVVSALTPLLSGSGSTWITAAVGEADRAAVAAGAMRVDGLALRPLLLDPEAYAMAYDVISNATLWFVHHSLFDLARRPRFDRRWCQAFDAYREVNHDFARAAAEVAPEGATVAVQDYHLTLVGKELVRLRPDLRTVHFTHTPFAGPEGMRVLPDQTGRELLEGMAAYGACGFHSRRWSAAFEASCGRAGVVAPPTFVAPLGVDRAALAEAASSEACAEESARLEALLGDRLLVLRVDRMELSKNLLRGFLAFDTLLFAHPELRERVVFLALAYASREGLAEYLAYRNEVETMAERLNQRWATSKWSPIVLDVADNYPRSVAALRRYDALLVNPVLDGLNLVAKEGPVVNERSGLVALSHEAGAWDELGDTAIGLNPFDIEHTASALHRALTLGPSERRKAAELLRQAAERRRPKDWLDDQLAAADRAVKP